MAVPRNQVFRFACRWLAVLLLAIACLTGAGFAEVNENTLPPSASRSVDIVPVQPQTVPRLKPEEMFNVKLRRFKGLNRIFHFDDEPLGNRHPVILVPGRAEEYQHSSWWKKLEDETGDSKTFQKHFKLYVFVYDSSAEVSEQAADFINELERHFGHLPERQKAILVTYSLGGVIIKEAFRQPEVQERVHTVFGIAVPYHGSPLFDPEWFSQYLQPTNRSPIRKFWDKLIYRLYMFNKTNLTNGLSWDNFDGSAPQFKIEDKHINGDQVRHIIPSYHEHPSVEKLKDRLIIYASFLENGYTETPEPMNPAKLPIYVLDKTAALPKELVGSILPFYGFTVHSVFTYMNHQLANLPTFTPQYPEGKNIHLYRFNDGAIPLSSMLFLPSRNQPYDDDFQGLIDAADAKKIRVFVNIDHMDIGEYRLRDSRIRVKDMLSPDKNERTPNEWVLHDILGLIPAL